MNLEDAAQIVEEMFREESLHVLRTASKPSLSPTGSCLWCGEPIQPGSPNPRFCDATHRDEYDRWRKRHPELPLDATPYD